ncbi:hypothetical protein LTS10_003802 [Elasticomyces elasticus]|nr:hypothetical protein LTS10_003802 [Elasticomyces elasticus]
MEDSPLWKLPVELRLNIYELVLHTTTISVCQDRRPSRVFAFIVDPDCQDYTLPAGGGSLQLLRVCKQINSEAGPLFYACNQFQVVGGNPNSDLNYGPEMILSTLHAFVAKIGPTNTKALSDVCFFIAPVGVETMDTREIEETKATLLEIFRRLHAIQIQRPYWKLKASMNCCMYSADGGTYDQDENPLLYEPAIDLKQPKASLMHAIADFESVRDSKDLCPAGVKTFTDFFRELGEDMARPPPLAGEGWFLPVRNAITS